jgi:CRP/FNR family transcriptional regulator, cyclic AMP receptor protein
MSEIRKSLQTLTVFKGAKNYALSILEKQVKIRTVKKGSHLFFDKEEVNSIYVIIKGCVTLYKINALGEKKVIFLYQEDALINDVIVNEPRASINCEVLKESKILVIPRTVFLQVMEEDYYIRHQVMNSMSIKIRRLYRQLQNTTNSMRGEKKLASKLWKLGRDYGKPDKGETLIDIELSITYLAHMLGSQRETVSRQMKLLTKENLIRIEKGRLYIPDSEKLKEFFERP